MIAPPAHNPYFAVEEERQSLWLRWLREHVPADPPPYPAFAVVTGAAVPLALPHCALSLYLWWRALQEPVWAVSLHAALLSTVPLLAWFVLFTCFCHQRRLWWAPSTLLAAGYGFFLLLGTALLA